MFQRPARFRRPLVVLLITVLASTPAATAATADVAPEHLVVVGAAVSDKTPDIIDGSVVAIHDAGPKVIAGGNFTLARNRKSGVDIARPYVLAFDKATGAIDTAFAPTLDDEVTAITAGPMAGTVFLAGRFNMVNGATRRKVALVDVATGALVAGFAGPPFNGAINDIALVGDRLLVGGIFTTATTTNPRGGLASLDAVTGSLDSYLTADLTEHHNWDGLSGARAGVGPEKLAVSPDGTQLVVIGNFKKADGAPHDQIVKLDLGATAATVTSWSTDRYRPRCAYRSFDSYLRDVAYSPDGSYFVVVTTGAAYPGTLCDSAARWEATTTGAAQQPTWAAYSGGDTLLSVAASGRAIYVGGHFLWMNNSLGVDAARAGAVGRASMAALDPLNGLPLAWNPGRHPRGYGVTELYATPEGLWLGHDQSWIGDHTYRRERIAFFPLAGGAPPHSTVTAGLPGKVYLAAPGGGASALTVRRYDGATAGPAAAVAGLDGTPWSAARGAFWVGGTLFYGMGSSLYRRTFDGTSFGPARTVDPYHDAHWDTVETGSGPAGQTYAGVTVDFYPEIPGVTAMCYANGRLYYTLSGQNGLFWRWFSPDSGAVGADRFTAATTGFANAAALLVSGDSLYLTDRTSGTLNRMGWTGTAPTGGATAVSGPAVDGVDWRAGAVFAGP